MRRVIHPISASALSGVIRLACGSMVENRGWTYDGKPKVFYANHGSNLDFPVIWASLPPVLRSRTRPVAANDYWTSGPVRRFLSDRVFRAILIERHKVTKSSHPIDAISNALLNEDSVIIFPEGTRSMDGELSGFKSGIFHIAKRFPDIEFVPVRLENLNRILPKGEFLLVPLMSRVIFGPPIKIEPEEEKASFLKRAESGLRELHS